MSTLQLVWVGFFVFTGLTCSWFAAVRDNDHAIETAVSSLVLAVAFAWDNAITLLFWEVMKLFPDEDAGLKAFTATVVTGSIVLICCASVLFSPFLFMNRDGEVSLKNFLKAFRHEGRS